MRLQGKTAIVTGGGSGFDEGIVRKFVAEGARVLIDDRDAGNAHRVAAATGALALQVDVVQAADVKRMVDAAFESFGGLDIVVNNAGVGHLKQPLEDLPEDDFDRMRRRQHEGDSIWPRSVVVPRFKAQPEAASSSTWPARPA